MRWPWRRPGADVEEAQRHLDRLERQRPEVARLMVESMRDSERNGFAERFKIAFEQRKGRHA